MTSQQTTTPDSRRRRSIWRMGGAGLLIVALGGAWYFTPGRVRDEAETPQVGAANSVDSTGGMADMAGMNRSQSGSVTLTADQIRTFGVTFGVVRLRPLVAQVQGVGTVMADETKLSMVTPKFGGFVEHLHVNAPGQQVRRGQPLMDVYSPELVAAEQELLVAANLDRTIGQSTVPGVSGGNPEFLADARRRLELWDIGDAQIDAVLRADSAQRTLTLYAQASGIVLDKGVLEGQAFQAGQSLYTIANLADVWIDVALREQDGADVRVGSRASVVLAAFPGQPIAGRVAYVYPTLDSTARAVRARIELPNTDGRLKLGMYGSVSIETPSKVALTVPTSAVMLAGDSAVVFVDAGGGALGPRSVVLGRVAGEYTEVLSGLIAGQRVVTSAQYLLDSEANLGDLMRSMIGMRETVPGMKVPPDAVPPRR